MCIFLPNTTTEFNNLYRNQTKKDLSVISLIAVSTGKKKYYRPNIQPINSK